MKNLIILLIAVSAHASDHKKISTSGKNHVQLVELYSSESCSSCPPADNWISTLKDNPGLWSKFVPLVFHVDYWNDLGWKDGFSASSMTGRQREIAETWSEPAVYTPAAVLDGREWKQWSNANLPSSQAPSSVQLTIYREAANDFQIAFEGLDRKEGWTVRIAKLGMDLNTDVTSGENSGRKLTHNFVVLDWASKQITPGQSTIGFTLSSKNAPRTAVVAWIEKTGRPIPVQATGGYL